jgi:hypothetical protein
MALLAAIAGCGPVVSGAHAGTPGNEVTMTTGGPSPAQDPSAPNGTVTVTEADNGETVHLHIGQRLRVVLGDRGQQWHRPASSGQSLRLDTASGGYPTGHPADAVFLAIQAGTASVTSLTDHPCLHAQPPCKIAQIAWNIHVLVAQPT